MSYIDIDRQNAEKIAAHVTAHGYDSKRQIASDLGLSEVEFEMASRHLSMRYGVIRQSYGRQVVSAASTDLR